MKTFKACSGYDRRKNREEKEYRFLTFQEAKQLDNVSHAKVLDRNGNVREVKINGRVKTWKTRPGDIDIPCKYGMYEYFTVSYRNGILRGTVQFVKEIE